MEARTKLREQFRADLPEFAGHDCSYEALHVVEPKHFSTKWGPTGFQKETHPLSIMVGYIAGNFVFQEFHGHRPIIKPCMTNFRSIILSINISLVSQTLDTCRGGVWSSSYAQLISALSANFI